MFTKVWTVVALAAVNIHLVTAATVMAHFMLDNSFAYNVDQWKTDMAAANQAGIDGFALNWIPPDCESPSRSWQIDRIDDAFTAAEDMGFALMFSFDMSYTVCDTFWNTTFMSSMVAKYAGSSATFRWNTNTLVSTFGGDKNDAYGNDFFQDLKDTCSGYGHSITLSPALVSYAQAALVDPSTVAADMVSDYPSIDGYFNWQAWPLTKSNLTISADEAFKSALNKAGKTGPYIMAVSPWQFKDLNDGISDDSWVSYSDTLFAQRLSDVATAEFSPDIIEVLTWNDFGESHYLRDVPDMTDENVSDYVTYTNGMENYVRDMDHAPFRVLSKYYLTWWKTGQAPAITMDQVVFWHRIHPKTAICLGGAEGAIKNYLYPADAVFAWVLVQAESTITVSVGDGNDYTFISDGSGPTLKMFPFPSSLGDGVNPEVTITRNGQTIANASGNKTITSDCGWTNFNFAAYLVGDGVNR